VPPNRGQPRSSHRLRRLLERLKRNDVGNNYFPSVFSMKKLPRVSDQASIRPFNLNLKGSCGCIPNGSLSASQCAPYSGNKPSSKYARKYSLVHSDAELIVVCPTLFCISRDAPPNLLAILSALRRGVIGSSVVDKKKSGLLVLLALGYPSKTCDFGAFMLSLRQLIEVSGA
jgi:hypothetical protein